MDNIFYFNSDSNICATEYWVIEYLFYMGVDDSRENIKNELRSKREFFGWYECTVSDDIYEKIQY